MSGDFAFPQSLVRGLSGRSYPQRPPHFEVAPSAQDGTPILTVSGVGKEPCCASCASGGPCKSCCGDKGVQMPACSEPKAPPSIPGSTSFPVGFGQAPSAPIATTSLPLAVVTGWGVPLAIGAVSIAGGFALAYALSRRGGA